MSEKESRIFSFEDDDSDSNSLLGDDVLRISYWSAFTGITLIVLITFMVFTPPPPRTWPRTKPLLGCIPSFIWARVLGYGVFDWRTGELLTLVEYFKERHEWLCVYFGDPNFIPLASRAGALLVDLSCTFSLNMVLTNPRGENETTRHYFSRTMAKFLALYIHMLLMSIALRLSSIGARNARRDSLFRACCVVYICLVLTAGVIFTHLDGVASKKDTCTIESLSDQMCTLFSYGWTFFLFELSWGIVIHSMELSFRWVVGRQLFLWSEPLPPQRTVTVINRRATMSSMSGDDEERRLSGFDLSSAPDDLRSRSVSKGNIGEAILEAAGTEIVKLDLLIGKHAEVEGEEWVTARLRVEPACDVEEVEAQFEERVCVAMHVTQGAPGQEDHVETKLTIQKCWAPQTAQRSYVDERDSGNTDCSPDGMQDKRVGFAMTSETVIDIDDPCPQGSTCLVNIVDIQLESFPLSETPKAPETPKDPELDRLDEDGKDSTG